MKHANLCFCKPGFRQTFLWVGHKALRSSVWNLFWHFMQQSLIFNITCQSSSNSTISTYHTHYACPSHNISPHHLYLIKGVSCQIQIWWVHSLSLSIRAILLLALDPRWFYVANKKWNLEYLKQMTSNYALLQQLKKLLSICHRAKVQSSLVIFKMNLLFHMAMDNPEHIWKLYGAVFWGAIQLWKCIQ